MCSHFLERMENYQGDLTDMLRATCGNNAVGDSMNKTAPDDHQIPSSSLPEWPFQSDPIGYPVEDFGDPFSHLRDPLLLHDMDINSSSTPSSSSFFHSNIIENNNHAEEHRTVNIAQKAEDRVDDHEMSRPPNIFSRMLQIPPTCAKLPLISNTCDHHHHPNSEAFGSPRSSSALTSPNQTMLVVASNDHHHHHHQGLNNIASPNSSKASCLLESSAATVQISSPRNTGIKRRKSQAKKVVCIPAPAPANSRASGEIVPSDLWAWRKYGQKPIKGSPYPRGYYRCSSSKGCSARKQVERSRTDPNMLVITYTSEHNHPWPTQRNALAGSTRSQQSKNNITNNNNKNNNATASSKASQNSSRAQKGDNHTNPKEEPSSDRNHEAMRTAENTQQLSSSVKEEINTDQDDRNAIDNRLEMEDREYMMSEGFPQGGGYKPSLQDHSSNAEDSFFAELGEIEASSLDMLFTRGFSGADADEGSDHDKGLNPFSFYDWDGTNNNHGNNNNNNKATSSAGSRTPNRDT